MMARSQACKATGAGPRAGAAVMAVALGLGVVVFARATPCRADDAQALELAKNRFDAGQYDEAHALFSMLLDPKLPPCDATSSRNCRLSDPDQIERARTLEAAVLLARGRPAEADALIEKILDLNRTYTPNPALFPQELVDRFTEIRARHRREFASENDDAKRLAEQKARAADEAWVAEIQKLASEERVVKTSSRWIAAVPFGVGQYQNGDVGLGVFFSVTQALLGATSIATGAVVLSLDAAFDPHNPTVDVPALQAKVNLLVLVNRIAFATWAAATVAGVVQAQVAFQNEKLVTRPRPAPPRPSLAPSVSMVPGGASGGLILRF